MLRYSGGHDTEESRKDSVVEGWGQLSRQTRVKTEWGIWYDGEPGRKAEDETDGTVERRASRD